MPFVIAGILYVLFAGAALTVVGGLCLVRWCPPARSILGGGVGSLVGFLFGCVASVLVCFTVPMFGIGARIGATSVVVVVSLGAALLGMVVGATASQRIV